MRATFLLPLALLLSCDNKDEEVHSAEPVETGESGLIDEDGDGYDELEDCDDTDATVNPGVEEDCNGVDDNCDDVIDEGVQSTYYDDLDGDGFGDETSGYSACEGSGGVPVAGDCDDADAGVNPAASELCDGLDNDCDGEIDDGASGEATWYEDGDGDGFGDDDSALLSCTQPDGFVAEGGDCADADAEIYPGASEQCDELDNDCDGEVDEDVVYTWYEDDDADGHGDPAAVLDTCDPPTGSASVGDDCDDAVATTYPGADELCNEVDDDCDGDVDDDPVDTGAWYLDTDGDGYGDPSTEVAGCSSPGEGYVAVGEDCDDADAAIHPDADELCNGYDDDCDGEVDEDGVDGAEWYYDGDGDGYGDPSTATASCESPGDDWVLDGTDCDDADGAFHPTADELCDSLDNDCDGEVDEDATDGVTWYYDDDADGYGDPSTTTISCEEPEEHVSDATDCDDLDATVHPGADEVCDGLDNDCDGSTDEGATGDVTWYADADGDGYGDDAVSSDDCVAPEGYVETGGDCDDGDTDYNPGATEDDCRDPNDYNCDGSTGYSDDDGDGYAACEECDDADAGVNPDATEVCDGVDNDCDGTVDGSDAVDPSTWYTDADSDGYGDPSTGVESCDAPEGAVADNTDCDDTSSLTSPADSEICDGADNDCDGSIDEDASGTVPWYADTDGDGYGDAGDVEMACSAPEGYVDDDTDCDDDASTAYPGADELCSDSLDNDCDGSTDEADAVDAKTYYRDSDGDTYGDATVTTRSCRRPSGYRARARDCDDTDSDIRPGARELCNDLDDDCDGSIDESVTDASTWYADSDGDGYGDSDRTSSACDAPEGYVSEGEDCDDEDEDVNPGETELCNGYDDDCDGAIDGSDASDATGWYADLDEDGFGDADEEIIDCDAPEGYIGDDQDCDDLDADINPDADEVCDGLDNDCDGSTDEDSASGLSDWYADADGDGYGDDDTVVSACDAPSGYVAIGGDCDDTDAAYNPGATESCTTRVDYNCDGSVGYTDADGDDVAACEDCDDGDADSYPGADEVCDGADNDCDGSIDESGASGESTWYADEDGDGYGDADSAVSSCDAPSGHVADGTDCDDTDGDVHPGALELCDDADNDCDGSTDEGAADAGTWYRDRDSDGYGDPSSSAESCDRPSGYAGNDEDCDDTDGDVNPDASELCNDADDDCDGSVDEGAADASTWYADSDGDGFGDASTTDLACDRPSGYLADSTDCDDGDADINPDASEVCNGLDDDCDGEADEEDAIDATTWYYDDDSDGYGDESLSTVSCETPTDHTDDATDCDDDDADINPGETDVCNGVDDDCSGSVDDGESCGGGCEVEYYEDNAYLFCGTARSWTEGQSWCASLGYHMLDIEDSAENVWAVDMANTYSTAKWWIGFNDRTTEGTFVWESGASTTYTNWHSGEPNDVGGEDCTQLNRFGDYTWNDEPCSSSFRFICEL